MKSKKKAKVKSKMKSKVGAGISATEFINKALVTHLLQHAGHLNLTAAEKQSLRDIVEHVGDRDHICTAYARDQNGQLRADNPHSLGHLPEKLQATLCEREWTQLELHNCRAELLLAMLQDQGIKCKTLQHYTMRHGSENHTSMIQKLRDCNDGVTAADVKCVVKQMLHGTPLAEALRTLSAQDGSPKITDTQWLPRLEQDIRDAVLKLRSAGSNALIGMRSSDTATHVDEHCEMDEFEVDPGAEYADDCFTDGMHVGEHCEMDEFEEDPGAEYVDDCFTDGVHSRAAINDGCHPAINDWVWAEIARQEAKCLQALYKWLKTERAITNECVLFPDHIMFRRLERDPHLRLMARLSHASEALKQATGVDIQVHDKPFMAGYAGTEPAVYRIVRELALQRKPRNLARAQAVVDNIVAICASVPPSALGDDAMSELNAIIQTWLVQPSSFSIAEAIAEFRSRSQWQSDAEYAWQALWTRRQKLPLVAFKTERITTEDRPLQRLLQNIDPRETSVHSLVHVTSSLWPWSSEIVYNFIRSNHARQSGDDLHDRARFEEAWSMPKPDSAMFKDALKEYIENAIASHEFIRSSLPAIMGKPVASYKKRDRELIFTLEGSLKSVRDDVGLVSMQHVEYQLNYATGEITSCEGHGVLHELFAGIRSHFQHNGGVNSMANLVYGQGFGTEMKFDQDEDAWRTCDPSTGIWSLALKDKPNDVLARFLKAKLMPIQHLAEFVGIEGFDWLSGAFAPKEDIDSSPCDAEADDESDEELADADNDDRSEDSQSTSGQKCGQKRKRQGKVEEASKGKKSTRKKKSEGIGTRSLLHLTRAIYRYVETPKHTAEVLKAVQHMLMTDFSVGRDQLHLLPCPNGVIDLKTGELLPKASPEDLFTHACATEYEPHADTAPAVEFYQQFFPREAYADQEALVRFMQQWFGYSLTLETRLELCIWFYGPGSNGKTILTELQADVLGSVEKGGVHTAIPMTSLCKGRGVNNDALYDARHARSVTISESDNSTKISEAATRALVTGEQQHIKQMYKKEVKVRPNFKIMCCVNELPQWDNGNAFCTTRRNLYVPLKKIYIDSRKAADRKQADEYRAQGMPECLIAQKDTFYKETTVHGHESAFLRFWVLGAMDFYQSGNIDIPDSLNEHQRVELGDKAVMVDDYVEDYLEVAPGAKTLVADITKDFRDRTGMGQMTFSDAKFFQALKKAIEEKGTAWESATKRNGRVNGTKGMLYDNVSFKERAGRLQSFMTETRRERHSAWRNSSTQDRFTADHAPFHAPDNADNS